MERGGKSVERVGKEVVESVKAVQCYQRGMVVEGRRYSLPETERGGTLGHCESERRAGEPSALLYDDNNDAQHVVEAHFCLDEEGEGGRWW